MDSIEIAQLMTAHYAGMDARWDPDLVLFRIKEGVEHWIDVTPMIHTAAIVTTPKRDGRFYTDRWCYMSVHEAITAAERWDPTTETEPMGWHRHPPTGRRRPAGDPLREHIRH